MFLKRLNNFYGYFLTISVLLITAYLSVAAFFKYTYIVPYLPYEEIEFRHSKPVITVFMIAFFVFIIILFKEKLRSLDTKFLLRLLLAFEFIFCTFFVAIANPLNVNDQALVILAAQTFTKGEYYFLLPSEYLGVFPHQLPLVLFCEPFCLLFGNGTGYILQYLQSFLICGIQYLIYSISKDILKDKKNENFILLFLFLDIPLLLYTTFIYGTVISLFLMLICIRLLMSYDKERGNILSVILAAMAGSIGCLLRKNCLIFFIAITVTIIFIAFKRHRMLLLFIPVFLCLYFAGVKGIKILYEARSGMTVCEGVPTTAWIATGLSKEENNMSGWFNGYTWPKYVELDYDTERTDAYFKEVIHETLGNMMASPITAFDLFKEKTDTTWLSPDFQSLNNNGRAGNAYFDTVIGNSLFYGKIGDVLLIFLNGIAVFIYLGTFFRECITLHTLIKEKEFVSEDNIFIVALLGGYLFHLLWETKAQYAIVYYCLLFPHAMAGWMSIIEKVQSIYEKKHNKA